MESVKHKEENRRIRKKYYQLVAGAAIFICVGLFGPFWVDVLWLRQWFSCSLGVGVILWLCCIALACYSYCNDVGHRYDFVALVPIYLFAGLAYLLDFQWNTLGKVVVISCGALLCFAPLLLLFRQQRREKLPDLLGRRLLYTRMGRTLRAMVGAQREHGVAVVVRGPWGVGKSHFINYLAADLQEPYTMQEGENPDIFCGHFVISSVDVWKSKDISGMWEDIAMALASAVCGYRIQLYNKWRTNLISFLQMLHLPVSSLADDVLRIATTGVDTGVGNHGKLKSRIQHSGSAYVLVLDNLDRCDERKREALFPLIESLKHIPGLVTICGYAAEELLEQEQGKHFVGTFQKLFDLEVPLTLVKPEYLKPYMEDKLRELNVECPYLSAWVAMDDSPFETPRQVETVIRQLSYIEQCYFDGWKEKEENDLKDSIIYTNSWPFTVFYWVALEMLFPIEALRLRGKADPMFELKAISSVGEQEYFSNTDEPKKPSVADENNNLSRNNKSLLHALAAHLLNSNPKYLLSAMNQEYLHLGALDDSICRKVIEKWNKSLTPIHALNDVLPGLFHRIEEPPMYDSVVQYAIRHVGENKTAQYLRACLDCDILPSYEKGEERKYASMYLKSDAFLLSLTDATLQLKIQAKEQAKEWEQMVSDVCSAEPLAILWHVLGGMLEYFEDEMENSFDRQAPYVSELLHHFSVRRNEQKERDSREPERSNTERHLLHDLMTPFLRGYGFVFCKTLLERKAEPKFGVLLVWHLERLMPQWKEMVLAGVETFLQSEVWQTQSQAPERVKETLLSAMVVEGFLLHENSDAMVAIPLSYVLMWSRMYELLLKPNLQMLTDVDRVHLREVQRLLQKSTPSPESGASDKRMRADGKCKLASIVKEMLDYKEAK